MESFALRYAGDVEANDGVRILNARVYRGEKKYGICVLSPATYSPVNAQGMADIVGRRQDRSAGDNGPAILGKFTTAPGHVLKLLAEKQRHSAPR